MFELQQNEATAAQRRIYFRLIATADDTAMTGATVTSALRKNGATATPGGTVTELAGGLYYYEASAGDLDTVGSILYTPSATGAYTFTYERTVVAHDPLAIPTAAQIRTEMDANSADLDEIIATLAESVPVRSTIVTGAAAGATSLTLPTGLALAAGSVLLFQDTARASAVVASYTTGTGATTLDEPGLTAVVTDGAAFIGIQSPRFPAAELGSDDRVLVSADAHSSGETVAGIAGTLNTLDDLENLSSVGAQTAAAAALTAYDPPTRAELTADIASLAQYIDTEVAAILVDTGTDIPAQITAVSALVDELESRLTAARAALLDNLDAAVSTRSAPGAAMALTTAERLALYNQGVASVAGSVQSVVSTVAANVTQIRGDAAAATNLEADYDGTGYNKAASAVGTVATVTNLTNKTGFALAATGLDAITATAPAGVATTFPQMLVQVWRRFFKRSVYDPGAGTIRTYADDNTTVVTTQAVSEVSSVETVEAAT